MTVHQPENRLRTGLLVILALVVLSWSSLQWSALLRRDDYLVPAHPWWSQVHPAHSIESSPTPRVQYHEWNITRADIAPDGVTRPMILVNNRFPGPPLQAIVGDTLVIKVNNQLSANDSSSFASWDSIARSRFSTRIDDYYPPGTDEHLSIHWHGLAMRGSPEQDGAPGFTSCAVLPGSSETYRFQVTQEDVGTHWWHSHTGMARSDGLWGTLVVRDPLNQSEEKLLSNAAEPLRWQHDQVITLGDHYFAPGVEQLSWFISRHSLGFEPTPDNILINGHGAFDCSRLLNSNQHKCSSTQNRYATIQLERGRTHRLRLINVGSVAHQTFSIDHHVLTVIEADGTIIEPYTTTRLSIAPGQRYSVLVTADRPANAFWLRSEMDHECFNMPNPNLQYQAKAVVRYTASPSSSDLELRTKSSKRNVLANTVLPQTQPWPRKPDEQPCHDEPARALRPLRHRGLGAPPAPRLDLSAGDKREIITVTMPKLDRNGLVPISWINRTQWKSPPTPLLHSFALSTANASHPPPFDPAHQTVLIPSPDQPVTLELVINNRDEAPHPFHLHGHKFHLVALSESSVGFGSYSPSGANIDAEWLDERWAPVRDTVSVPRRGFAVLRWKTDNPGVWAMHCHVLVHMQTGMALALVDQPHKLSQLAFATGSNQEQSATCPGQAI